MSVAEMRRLHCRKGRHQREHDRCRGRGMIAVVSSVADAFERMV